MTYIDENKQTTNIPTPVVSGAGVETATFDPAKTVNKLSPAERVRLTEILVEGLTTQQIADIIAKQKISREAREIINLIHKKV